MNLCRSVTNSVYYGAKSGIWFLFLANRFGMEENMSETVMQALEIMGKGMLGIFVALIVIMLFVMIMAKLGKKKD